MRGITAVLLTLHTIVGGTLAVACGGAKPPVQAAPLSAEQQRVFDNGVDFIASLEGLEGRWRDDWERDLSVRVGDADLIAVATVRTLRTDSDPQQQVTYRLLAGIDRTLVGSPPGKELSLTISPGDPGYPNVEDSATRLTDTQFVVYLRHSPSGPRFHLSHASPAVLTETERKITELGRASKKSAGERVIVHTN